MKKTIYILFWFLLVASAFSLDVCQDIQSPGVSCVILTPIVDCSTYDLYNTSLELNIDDGTMSQLGSTRVYNFTFSQSIIGPYKIILCDNTTATISVANYSLKNIYNQTNEMVGSNSTWVNNVAHKVWSFIVNYVNPSGSTLNASDTLKTIAEYTEYGGY